MFLKSKFLKFRGETWLFRGKIGKNQKAFSRGGCRVATSKMIGRQRPQPFSGLRQGQKRAGAAKPRKTAASPAPGHAALACGNAACGKALGPPLLQCFKCKAELLLQGVPGGRPGRPRPRRAQRAPFASAHPPAHAPVPPACTPRTSAGTVAGHAPAGSRRIGLWL